MYDIVSEKPKLTLLSRIKTTIAVGEFLGLLATWIIILDLMFSWLWEFLSPTNQIEKAEDFDFEEYKGNKENFGDHSFIADYYKSE